MSAYRFVTRAVSAIAVVTATAALAAGCGSASNGSASGDGESEQNVTTIKVGTEGTYAPYTYIGDDNQIDGYDVQVVKEIDKQLKDYKFEFVPTEWSSMFASLDAGKIDMIANQVAKNDEREAKYLFSDEAYSWSNQAIVFKKGRTDIKTIKDLYGKKVDAGLTSANTTWLEDYNKKNGNKIQIVSTDGDVSKMLQDIVNGRVDATLNSPVTVRQTVKEQGIDVDWVAWNDQGIVPEYLTFPKTDEGEKLKKAVDPVIKKLIEDGTLKKLSEKYLGADYSTEEAVKNQAE